MKPSDAKTQLINGYKARTPMYMWGAPGIGKSDITRQVADELEVSLIDERLSQMDPTDLKGIPYVKEAPDGNMYTHYAIPGFLPRVERDGPNGIFFLDELGAAPQAIQAAGYQLILDGKLGDYTLPEGWVCMAAGNRAEDRAIAIRLSTALANRFGHIDMEVDIDEWKLWAFKNGIDPIIISFINYRTNMLHNMDVTQRAFPTPRSWEKLNRHLPLVNAQDEFFTFAAFIGEGAAGEFSGYKKLANELPLFEEIIKSPTKIKIPTNPSTLYATSGMMSTKVTLKNFETVMKFMGRMPVEYQTVFMTDATAYVEDLENHDEFAKWALANNNVIL